LKLVFIQSFSLADVCGGARILRSVADTAPIPVASVCTRFGRDQTHWNGDEALVPCRPSLGRLDRTRFHGWGGFVERLWQPAFQRRLEAHLRRLQATDVHLLPHSWGDFEVGWRAARTLNLRVHTSIHDDFQYTAEQHPYLADMEQTLGELWRSASTRFVITREMGEEYNRRYGQRTFLIHTDGTAPTTPPHRSGTNDPVQIFFMGLFLPAYRPNFETFLAALGLAHQQDPLHRKYHFKVRTYGYEPTSLPAGVTFESLPFAPPEIVEQEAHCSDFLYLPLPFDPHWTKLNHFSLSTKMVSYLGAGAPIVYHGPGSSAAGQYLQRNGAAFQINTTDVAAMTQSILSFLNDKGGCEGITEKAEAAARRDFDKATLKQRFWDTVLHSH
jgi:glycosyltransferase involved in cell wall biosynthesis